MKKLFSIIAVLAIAICSFNSASAQDTEMATVLNVNLKDGTVESFKLTDEPTVKFVDHKIVIYAPTMECEYDFDSVNNFSFTKDPLTGIEAPAEETAFSFTFVDNANVIIYAPELQWAAAYSIKGTEVARATANADNTVTLNLGDAAPGVYVIASSCHKAIKIVKR